MDRSISIVEVPAGTYLSLLSWTQASEPGLMQQGIIVLGSGAGKAGRLRGKQWRESTLELTELIGKAKLAAPPYPKRQKQM